MTSSSTRFLQKLATGLVPAHAIAATPQVTPAHAHRVHEHCDPGSRVATGAPLCQELMEQSTALSLHRRNQLSKSVSVGCSRTPWPTAASRSCLSQQTLWQKILSLISVSLRGRTILSDPSTCVARSDRLRMHRTGQTPFQKEWLRSSGKATNGGRINDSRRDDGHDLFRKELPNRAEPSRKHPIHSAQWARCKASFTAKLASCGFEESEVRNGRRATD